MPSTTHADKEDPPPLGRTRAGAGEVLKFLKTSLGNLFWRAKKFHKLVFGLTGAQKNLAFKISFLAVIIMMPMVSEAAVNYEFYSELKSYADPPDPIRAGEFAQEVSRYLPASEAKSEEVALALMLKSDSYTLAQQLLVNTDKQIEEPQRQESTYTVGEGETITEIAQKFNLHVATILDANSIDVAELKKIHPGTVINIPSSDTSTSKDWLVAVAQIEEEERQKREEELRKQRLAEQSRRRVLAASSSATRTTSAAGYGVADTGGYLVPISHRGISRGYSRGHRGIDYMANAGTPVYAAAAGTVITASHGWGGGYGNQIVVSHGGGRATRYAHLSTVAVSAGQSVSRGQVIGYSGNTGRSTGPHLHFEKIVNGSPVP